MEHAWPTVLVHLSKLDFETECPLTHTKQTEHEELLTSETLASTEFRASTDLRVQTHATLTNAALLQAGKRTRSSLEVFLKTQLRESC